MKVDQKTTAGSKHKEQPVHAGGNGHYLEEIYTSNRKSGSNRWTETNLITQ